MKKQTLPQLVKKADDAFSRYIRLRDSELRDGQWVGTCISCPRQLIVVGLDGKWGLGIDAGHFVSRGHKVIRWDEFNVNMQCRHCNIWRDKESMLTAYKNGLDMKYGDGVWQRLKIEGEALHKPTRDELEQIITDSKAYVEYTLSHPL